MTVTVHSGSSVQEYSGKANQVDCHSDYVAMIGRRITLGQLAPGQAVEIGVEVMVPQTVNNTHGGTLGKFWWNFTAEDGRGTVIEASPVAHSPLPWWRAPQTGDGRTLLPWALLLVLAALGFGASLRRAKRAKTR